MNGDEFKKGIDSELVGLKFSDDAAQKVLKAVGKPQGRLKAFLEREIRIPVQPIAAALLIAATVMAYAVAGATRVTPEDVQKSRIVVVENDGGRNGK